MVLPGHLAGGYISATLLLGLVHTSFSADQMNALLLIGTLAGELPDVDLFFFNVRHRRDEVKKHDITESENHRNYITHVPFFWLMASLLIAGLGFISGSKLIEYTGWMILVGTWSHLILDSVEYGIRWLAPWSNKHYALKQSVPHVFANDRPGSLLQYSHFLTRTYWRTVTFWLEILVTLAGMTLFFMSL